MAAVMAAYRRGAFKKAAGFAKTLLERDPINRAARNMLLSSQLAHARKQIRAGKHDLATRELDTAMQFAQEADQRGVVSLNQGFLELLTGPSETGVDLLRQAYHDLGESLVAYFRFLVDGRRLGMGKRMLGKYFHTIKAGKEPSVTAKDILQLVDLVNRYLSDGVQDISEILDQLRKPLKAAARFNYAEKEMQGICAAFERTGHHGLLRDYAEAALARWGHRPIFLYYSVFGRTKGWSDRMTGIEKIEIQNALSGAIEEDDHEAIDLIDRFLGISALGPGLLPFLPPGPPPPDLEEALEGLVDELGADGLKDMMDAFEDILKGGLPVPDRPRRRRK
jgi:hypothetical protein